MIDIVFYVFLVFKGIEIIVVKYDGYDRFQKFASTKPKLVFQLSKCKFCMDHHLAILPTLLICWNEGFQFLFLFLPIASATLNNILNDFSKRQ